MQKILESRFQSAVQNLQSTKILVIGDLILDEYLFGSVNRISPEAPVPVVWVRKEDITLGGAGNVVKNLRTLGNPISVMGRIGKDEKGKTMKELLTREGLTERDQHLLESQSVPTILKTRILAGHQQVCRVDREENTPLNPEEESLLFQSYKKILPNIDGIILSDYDKGLLSPGLIGKILDEAHSHSKVVTVDPQVSHFFKYHRATIMTPNHHEAGKALGRVLEEDARVEEACREIATRLESPHMMITRGEKGMTVYRAQDDSIHHIPTVAKEVFDVTGAGDTVITVFTAFHCAGLDAVEASMVANAAAGVVVGKLGAATASIQEIHDKLIELESLKSS